MYEDLIMTVPQVAIYLKHSKASVYRMVPSRQIPHVRLGKSRRIRRDHLEAWLKTQSVAARL